MDAITYEQIMHCPDTSICLDPKERDTLIEEAEKQEISVELDVERGLFLAMQRQLPVGQRVVLEISYSWELGWYSQTMRRRGVCKWDML